MRIKVWYQSALLWLKYQWLSKSLCLWVTWATCWQYSRPGLTWHHYFTSRVKLIWGYALGHTCIVNVLTDCGGEEERRRADVDRPSCWKRSSHSNYTSFAGADTWTARSTIKPDGYTVEASVKVLMYRKFRTYKLSKGKQNSFTLLN